MGDFKVHQHDKTRSAQIVEQENRRYPYAVKRVEGNNINTYSYKNLEDAERGLEIILGVFRHQDNPSAEELEYQARIAAAKQYELDRRSKLNDGYGIR